MKVETKSRTGIAVLAKAPIAGKANTRLIPLLGEVGAAQLHQQLTFQALETACATAPGNVTLFTGSDPEHPFFAECVRRYGIPLVPQQGDDIGERMLHAIQHLSSKLDRVLLIGTDCPALTPDNLRDAEKALHGDTRMVFIPAEDGGYVLVGATDVAPAAFSNVNWGTADVMSQTRTQLSGIGWKRSREWVELPTLWDVDRPDDYRRAISSGHIRYSFDQPAAGQPESTRSSSDIPTPILSFPNLEAVSLSIRASALVFADPKSKQLLSLIEKVAPTNATALIMGETGTGKELVARHIHALSSRSHGPFAAVNCGAFTESLVESELFGHERGAFTGAATSKQGWFEVANGGTLLLDEIGDLPLSAQVKILRVLQQKEIVRVGSREPMPVDVRLVTATNVDLEKAVSAGHFREDLFYRINVFPVELLPLRERPGDILPLARHFLKVYTSKLQTATRTLTPEAVNLLEDYPWPGNIRELENIIHRVLIVSSDTAIKPSDLNLPTYLKHGINPDRPAGETALPFPANLELPILDALDRAAPDLFEKICHTTILTAYEHCGRNQSKTAAALGIGRNVLRAHLKNFGIL